jgi:hypothetical protein
LKELLELKLQQGVCQLILESLVDIPEEWFSILSKSKLQVALIDKVEDNRTSVVFNSISDISDESLQRAAGKVKLCKQPQFISSLTD